VGLRHVVFVSFNFVSRSSCLGWLGCIDTRHCSAPLHVYAIEVPQITGGMRKMRDTASSGRNVNLAHKVNCACHAFPDCLTLPQGQSATSC